MTSSRDCYITPLPVNQLMNVQVTYGFGQCTWRPEQVTFGGDGGGEGDDVSWVVDILSVKSSV